MVSPELVCFGEDCAVWDVMTSSVGSATLGTILTLQQANSRETPVPADAN